MLLHSCWLVTCTQGPGYPPYKDGLAGVQRLGAIHDKVTVTQVPGTDLDLQEQDGKSWFSHVSRSMNNTVSSRFVLMLT